MKPKPLASLPFPKAPACSNVLLTPPSFQLLTLVLELSLAIISVALLVGASKGGLPGIGILVVPIMAHIYPPKSSTGILLPMLLMADIMAVTHYHRHANWKQLLKLLPSTLLGVVMSAALMSHLGQGDAKRAIGLIILCMSILVMTKNKTQRLSKFASKFSFSIIAGIAVGIATMMANAAGPIAAIYLLSLHLDKETFIGTRAWFFLIINAFKIPFSIGLGLISTETLMLNLKTVPFMILGVIVGIQLTKLISNLWFSRIVLGLTLVSALKLLFL
jgi:uncharacterized membrane protein YfcA